MAGQSWAGIETVHTHCSQWTHSHTHTLPTVNSFLMSAGFPCPAGVDQEEGDRREGAFEASISCLRFGVIKNFLKAFCGTSTWKPSLSEMRDETRWDELSDTQVRKAGGGSEKRNFVKLEINLRFVCCRFYCAAAAAAVATLTPAGRQSIFFCVFTSSCCCSCCT